MDARKEKTKIALARIAAGEKPYAVAKDMNMSPNTLYVARARERIRSEGRCECCGQKLPEKTT